MLTFLTSAYEKEHAAIAFLCLTNMSSHYIHYPTNEKIPINIFMAEFSSLSLPLSLSLFTLQFLHSFINGQLRFLKNKHSKKDQMTPHCGFDLHFPDG
jgi:hypothetical protein